MRGKVVGSIFVISLLLWASAAVSIAVQEASSSLTAANETVTLKIDGMTCASCAGDIRKELLGVPGVKRADVSYAQGGAILEVEPGRVTPEQLIRAVASAGNILSSYRATVVPNGTLTAEAAEQGGLWSRFLHLFR